LHSDRIDRYYIGTSQNPQLRLHYHNTSLKGWTQRGRPWKIVFSKEYDNSTEAERVERKIKSWKSKRLIEKLVEDGDDLVL
jgi:putative endonuclease